MFVRVAISVLVAMTALTWLVLTRHEGQGAQARADDRVAHQAVDVPVSTPAVAPAPATSSATRPTEARKPKTSPVSTVSTTPKPTVNACAHNTEDKAVLVSLAAQHVWMCAGDQVHADFAVTTGRTTNGDATPTGSYEIQARTRDTTLNPDSGGAFHVQYWLPFKWGMFGFHDAPWQTIPFGSEQYRTEGSQGCVHMRTADIARLFRWVDLGTTVTVMAGAPAA